MPAAFDRAVRAGAKVRTISGPNKKWGLKAGEYLHIAILGGKVIRGEVKKEKA